MLRLANLANKERSMSFAFQALSSSGLFSLDAAVGGSAGAFPPIHPILVNFTAALIPASFAADLLGAWLNRDGLRQTAWWTLLLAAVITPFTALFGWVWLWAGSHGGGTLISIHQWLGTILAIAVVGMAIWRGMRFKRGGNRPGWAYGIVAAVLLGGVMVQGDVGGAMSFGQGIVVSGSSHQHGDNEHNAGTDDHTSASSGTDHHSAGSSDHPAREASGTQPAAHHQASKQSGESGDDHSHTDDTGSEQHHEHTGNDTDHH